MTFSLAERTATRGRSMPMIDRATSTAFSMRPTIRPKLHTVVTPGSVSNMGLPRATGAVSNMVTRLMVLRTTMRIIARLRMGVEMFPLRMMSTPPACTSSTVRAAVSSWEAVATMSSSATWMPVSPAARRTAVSSPTRMQRATMPWSRADSTRRRSSARSPPGMITVFGRRCPRLDGAAGLFSQWRHPLRSRASGMAVVRLLLYCLARGLSNAAARVLERRCVMA